ncbi:cupin domain-containing protein [Amphibacillus sp. MSJ-3]|nr:cupin domain-containing protein [Amphibacillus sp. MSJ-3]
MINKIPHNETIRLAEQIEIVPNRKTSKSLVQHKTLTLTLFALDAGQQIARHTATGDALVQILEGEALITIDQTDYTVKAGESIVMPAEIPHALEAVEAFKMLLTVVKPGE